MPASGNDLRFSHNQNTEKCQFAEMPMLKHALPDFANQYLQKSSTKYPEHFCYRNEKNERSTTP